MTEHPAPDASPDPTAPDPWTDLQAYVALPRLGDLVTGPDGQLLVAVSTLDEDGTGRRTAWWRLDPTGARPAVAHTRSVEGEGSAAYLPDGRLLFTSGRPVPAGAGEDAGELAAVWCLPAGGGEASVLASREGGWTSVTTARAGARAVLGLPVMLGAADLAEDAARRRERRKRKISALLHTGAAVRFWDHDLGPDAPQLVATDLPADLDPRSAVAVPAADLPLALPDPGRALAGTPSLSADGRWAAVTWQTPVAAGATASSVALVDLDAAAAGRAAPVRVVAAATDAHDFRDAVLAPDGGSLVCVRDTRGTADEPSAEVLWVVDVATGEGRALAEDWDRRPTPALLTPDGTAVLVTVDDNGHRPIYAVDLTSGRRRRLTDLGAHSALTLSWDGRTLYALRSEYTDPGSVIAVDLLTSRLEVLPRPVAYPAMPGRLENVELEVADGTRVRGYLATPTTASRSDPAPLVLWVHGGPFSSWNAWSWRWCPWLLVAQGYAVLLPDPALSTGYGQGMVRRGWTDWGGTPYTDLMAITDLVEQRPDVDDTRTAVMGGSFGGYMANWIAGHTDRFRAVVSHAGLWDLATFLPTTDLPWFWARELTPEMRRRCSPARFADQVRTPVLVVHGDRDYRVPVGEGLALWWDLVSRHEGPPEDLPHRFLQFPDENHWVLAPQHAVVWYETVLTFLDVHVRGGNAGEPPAL
ncbi:S9 family peptidase [Microlunatus capsulatus]|uniref:S9 family peptidase n=1 Tax=Microlunatus capsulatus TaxID=99117 RepID=UPI0031DF99A9